jgi:hypothetical protein
MPVAVQKVERPMFTVLAAVLVKRNAKRNSFQEKTRQKMAVTGVETGETVSGR